MGIADRRYADSRQMPRMMPGLHLVSFNTWLIIINSAVFIVGAMWASSIGKWIHSFGYFSTFDVISRLEFWRVVTFQFLHANITHLFFNMIGLYMFGELVERALGFKKYAAFYLVCGIFGAMMYLTLNLLGSAASALNVMGIPGLLYPVDSTSLFSHSQLIGASAGVFGVIVAAAYISPDSVVNLLFPPIPLKLKVFAYGYVAIALVSLLIGSRNAGGEAAHLGGAMAGFFFIRRSHLLADFFDVFTDSRKQAPRRPIRPTRQGADAKPGWFAKLSGTAPPSRADIDRILDKLRAEGLASLTEHEKDALRRATEAERGP